MIATTLRRLVWEQRIRWPLEVALLFAWGLALVGVFATADDATRTAGLAGNAAIVFRIAGLEPLAAWISIGALHPIFIIGNLLFAAGLGVRSVAGEIEDGTLPLALARGHRRSAQVAAYALVLVPGALVTAGAYGVGSLTGAVLFDPPGRSPSIGRMALVCLNAALLFVACGAVAMAASAFFEARGTALGWAIGTMVAMYALNFLLRLWEPVADGARLTLFAYFDPAPTLQRGVAQLGDMTVLALVALAGWAFAALRLQSRDIAA